MTEHAVTPDDVSTDTAAASHNVAVPPAPMDPPRPLTPRARRRAWAEPRVRALWLAAMAAFLVSGYFVTSRYLEWRREAWLITQGLRVNATVTEAGGILLPNKVVPPATPVTLEYEAGGRKVTVQGTLKGRKEHIMTGGTVPIRVHPDDPEEWTALTTPRPLRMELLGAAIVLPFAVVLGIVAWVLQRRVLRLWHRGEVIGAVVIDSTHTAVAPKTHLVRCTPTDPNDRRLLQAYLPGGFPRPQQGAPMWLIAPPDPSTRAVTAEWFE